MLMTRTQFARALYQGLGRPLVYAHAHATDPFADLIVQACLYNPLYDRLTGVDRAPYLGELIAATGAEASFRARILAALADPDDDMDAALLFDLALPFAQGGDAAARHAMRARFRDNLRNGDTTGADQLIALDGDAGLRVVVTQIGAAIRRAVAFTDGGLPARLLDDLAVAFADDPSVLNDPRVAAFRTAARGSMADQAATAAAQARRRQLRETLAALTYAEVRQAAEAKELSVMGVIDWGTRAPASELRRAADELRTTSDPARQQWLLSIFSARDFPDGHVPLLPFLDRPEPRLAHRAAQALARFRHPALRARALTLLAQPATLEHGLILLVGNHASGDYALLTALAQAQTDDDALHAIGWWAHALFTRAPAPEAADLLLTLYERGPCAQCRQDVVADVIALDALPAHLAEECRFDANQTVRGLVAGMRG